MHFAFASKAFEKYWRLLGWMLFFSFMSISIWFTWGVLDKFTTKSTGIWQYEENIESHPTVTICLDPFWDYGITFNITYRTYKSDGFSTDDSVVLQLGDNDLGTSKEKVNLTTIHGRFYEICYAMDTTRKVDEGKTQIEAWSTTNLLSPIKVFFTSDKNKYGVTNRDWRDGKPFSIYTSLGKRKVIELTVEKNVHVECSKKSFYEHVEEKLHDQSFAKCNISCLRTSLPNDPYPICVNAVNWTVLSDPYYLSPSNIEEKESDCNWKAVRDLIQSITANDEHGETCITTQYSGKVMADEAATDPMAFMKYQFALPLKTKVSQEYIITDSTALVGSVGGTLGMFIGFSFNNFLICIIGYLKILMKEKFQKEYRCTTNLYNFFWKCLEWTVYISLLVATLSFTWDVNKKYVAQNTGIKLHEDQLESHPSLTICPFLVQCPKTQKLGE